MTGAVGLSATRSMNAPASSRPARAVAPPGQALVSDDVAGADVDYRLHVRCDASLADGVDELLRQGVSRTRDRRPRARHFEFLQDFASVRHQPLDLAAGPDTRHDGDVHHPSLSARHADGKRPGPDLVAQEDGPDVLVIERKGLSRKDVCRGEVGRVTEPEARPGGVVQIDDLALAVDDPDEVRRVVDVTQQQSRNIEFGLVHPAPA